MPAFAQTSDIGGGRIPTLAPLVRETTPAVVNISVRGRVKQDNPLYRDPFFREFFGLAVPINMARWVMEQLITNGEVRRGRIGVSIRDLGVDGAVPKDRVHEGAVIAGVLGGSPAERAGLQKGDVVVAVDGAIVRSAAQLRNRIGLTPIGHRMQVEVRRDSGSRTLTADVEAPQAATKRTEAR